MADEGIYGISEVLTAEQAKKYYHLSGEFSFVIESDGYTSFHDDWRRPGQCGRWIFTITVMAMLPTATCRKKGRSRRFSPWVLPSEKG